MTLSGPHLVLKEVAISSLDDIAKKCLDDAGTYKKCPPQLLPIYTQIDRILGYSYPDRVDKLSEWLKSQPRLSPYVEQIANLTKQNNDSLTIANAIAPKAGVPPEVVLEFITTLQTKVVDIMLQDSLKERLKHDLNAR